MESATDSALMLRYLDGDADAFDELYRRHRSGLYRYFARQVPRETVDDLFQELWLRVIRTGGDRYRPTGPFAAYLYRIAHNVLVDFYRRSSRRAELDVRYRASASGDSGDAPAAAYMTDALRQRLLAALAELPQPQREAFLLQQEGGLTLAEIGQVVGASRETVKSRLRYALSRLRKALDGDGVIEEQRA